MKRSDTLSENYVQKLSKTYGIGMVISMVTIVIYQGRAFSKTGEFLSTEALLLIAIFIIITVRRDSLLENRKIYKAITEQGKKEE